jgi:hypothetical protein
MPAFLKQKKTLLLLSSAVVALVLTLTFFFLLSQTKGPENSNKDLTNTSSESSQTLENTSEIIWQWSGDGWLSSGIAPSCPTPVLTELPVDINQISAILYPGQTRGGNYKPHGGFRFGQDNSITVTAPLEANLVEGSRYIEGGETQYLFTFINSCGIAYRFDHLHTLSEKFQQYANTLPEAKVDDSRTTMLTPPIKINKGDSVATKVGFVGTKNVSLDFGVYDLRNSNTASKNTSFAQAHENEKQFAFYGICWLKEYPSEISQKLLALPGGDSISGRTSDYCN